MLYEVITMLVEGFHVGGFWSALFGSLAYSLISWALSSVLVVNGGGACLRRWRRLRNNFV